MSVLLKILTKQNIIFQFICEGIKSIFYVLASIIVTIIGVALALVITSGGFLVLLLLLPICIVIGGYELLKEKSENKESKENKEK